jgi:hypothetical protein
MDLSRQSLLAAAIRDPTEVYARPMDVVDDARLSPADKKRILDGWHLDALRLSESEAENMGGGERAHLREVMLALEELERRTAAH